MVPKDKYGGIDVLVNNAAIAFKNAAPEPMGVQVRHRPRRLFLAYTVSGYLEMGCNQCLFPLHNHLLRITLRYDAWCRRRSRARPTTGPPRMSATSYSPS